MFHSGPAYINLGVLPSSLDWNEVGDFEFTVCYMVHHFGHEKKNCTKYRNEYDWREKKEGIVSARDRTGDLARVRRT